MSYLCNGFNYKKKIISFIFMEQYRIGQKTVFVDSMQGTLHDIQGNVIGVSDQSAQPVILQDDKGNNFVGNFSPIAQPVVNTVTPKVMGLPQVMGIPQVGMSTGVIQQNTIPNSFAQNNQAVAISTALGGNAGQLNTGTPPPSLTQNVLKIVFNKNTSGAAIKVVIGDFSGLIKANLGITDNLSYPQGYTVSYANSTTLTDLQNLGGANSAPLGVLPPQNLQGFQSLKVSGLSFENTTSGSTSPSSAIQNGTFVFISGNNMLSATNLNTTPLSVYPSTSNTNYTNVRQDFQNVNMELGAMQALIFDIQDGEALTLYVYVTGVGKAVSLNV